MSEDTRRIYRAGETLLREGEYGDEAFVVLRGSVSICRELEGRLFALVEVGPGQVIGEMGLVGERPRSATAVAAVDTLVEVISRKRFRTLLHDDTDLAMDILKVLFERLRQTQGALLEWQLGRVSKARLSELRVDEAPVIPSTRTRRDVPPETEATDGPVLLLTGVSDDAIDVLPEGGLRVERYPFRIGRRTNDPLVQNDFEIDDVEPYQVSRSHFTFLIEDARVAIMDRGSYLGLEINGQRLGGEDGDEGVVFLKDDNRLWLGAEDSSYEFRIEIL